MRDKLKKIAGFLLMLIFVFGLRLSAVQALELLDPGLQKDIDGSTGIVADPNYNSSTDETTLVEMVSYVVAAFLGLLATIFIILIVISGYNWLTAGGNEEKVEKARHTMSRAIIGLIVTTAAYAITWFIFARLPDNIDRYDL